MTGIKAKALSASRWAFGAELVGRALSPLVFLILAAFLTPGEFGVATAAAAVISFSQNFWSLGLGRALIQTDEDIDKVASLVFWLNLGLSVLVYLVLFVAAGWIATTLFDDERVTAVLRVQGAQLILGALCSVHSALLERSLNFRATFWIKLGTLAIPGLSSIPLALLGYGYWALVAGSLAGGIANLVVLWYLSPWRPQRSFDWRAATQTLRFGTWVMGSAIVGWFYMWMDSLVVGHYFGSTDMGIYRAGTSLVSVIFALLINPAIPVLFATLSRLKNDAAGFQRSHFLVAKAVCLLSLSAGAGLWIMHREIGELLFAERWHGVDRVIAFVGLFQGVSWIWAVSAEAYRAKGHADVEPKSMLLGLVYYVPVYLLTARSGMESFLWGRLLVAAGSVLIQGYFMPRFLNMTVFSYLRRLVPAMTAVASMALAVGLLRGVLDGRVPTIVRLPICIVVAIGVVTLAIRMLERELFRTVLVPLITGFFGKKKELKA